jgi:hypothetical protein
METTNALQVAETIANQLGGTSKLSAMMGAKEFIADAKSLTFKVGRNAAGVKKVRVVLCDDDTYTVLTVSKDWTVVEYARGLDVAQMRGAIERCTGMYLSL